MGQDLAYSYTARGALPVRDTPTRPCVRALKKLCIYYEIYKS